MTEKERCRDRMLAGELAMETLLVKTERRTQLVDVTERVQRAVAQSGVSSGVCTIYVPHTTAGVLINEQADPDGGGEGGGAPGRVVLGAGGCRHTRGNNRLPGTGGQWGRGHGLVF